MKKTIALLTTVLIVKSASSQDITSKKGEPILPEAGDYMIGIELNPFLNYISHGVSPTFSFMNGNNMIIGKYYKDAQKWTKKIWPLSVALPMKTPLHVA